MKKSIKIVASAAGLAALVSAGASVSAIPEDFPKTGDGGVPRMLNDYRNYRCMESDGVVALTNTSGVYCSVEE